MTATHPPVRWGIIGAGRIAEKFAAGLRMLPDAELRAVASRDNARGAAFAGRNEIPQVHSSYESLVAAPDIDVVYIATLNVSHHANALLCLNAGKAVLCEKPFTMTAREAHDVIAAARRNRVFCMEAMWMRFVPLARALTTAITDGGGIIGDVRAVSANLGFAADYDPRSRLFDKQQGGGALLDLGVYPISFIHMILGAPRTVLARSTIGKSGVDESVTAELTFAGGVSATMETSITSLLSGDATLFGSAGSIHVHGPLYCPTAFSLDSALPDRTYVGESRSKMTQWIEGARRKVGMIPRRMYPVIGNGYAHQAIEVMRCLRANELESNILPLDETLRVMETLDGVRAALGHTGDMIVPRTS